jgi:hypothetical protein
MNKRLRRSSYYSVLQLKCIVGHYGVMEAHSVLSKPL